MIGDQVRQARLSLEKGGDNKMTDKYLNVLVAVTTCIVFFLIYDQVDNMLTPYTPIAGQDAAVQVLQDKCSDVWKSHQKNRTGTDVTGGSKPEPKYSVPGFCTRLPADVSPAHLWNKHLDWILEASSNDKDISSHLLTSKLLQFLSPSRYLRLGLRSRPSQDAWGRVLEKIEARLNSDTAPIVHVAAFGVGGGSCEKHTDDPNQDLDIDCLWSVRLEAFINTILNHGLPGREKRAIINITPMYHPEIAVTTDFDSAIVKHGLWLKHLNQHGGPDVIINAYNAQDMFSPKRGWKTAEDINYYHQQRRIVQDFMRACLLHRPCSSEGDHSPKPPPLLINIDDYVGNQQGPVLAETTQGRVVQLLSDYYELSFISYAEVIRRFVYAASDFSSLKHVHLKDWTSDWAALAEKSKQGETIENGMIGPIALTMTIAYSLLSYTVGYCSHQSQKLDDFSLIPESVFHLAQKVPPPELNTDLCLVPDTCPNDITGSWQLEQTKQEKHAEKCKNFTGKVSSAQCSFAFWAGTHPTQASLNEYMKPFVKENTGWETQDGGRIVATQSGATLGFQFPLNNLYADVDKVIRLFSVRKDIEVMDPSTRLQWEISIQGSRRTRKRFLQQSNAASISGSINATHDSPTTVALPTNIPIGKDFVGNGTTAVDLRLTLKEGDSFEIVSLMFCDDP